MGITLVERRAAVRESGQPLEVACRVFECGIAFSYQSSFRIQGISFHTPWVRDLQLALGMRSQLLASSENVDAATSLIDSFRDELEGYRKQVAYRRYMLHSLVQ